ncbi:hypothetical protein [Gluconobacter sp.]|uniref:hypothetical protein n=1 Tax=Gluconobacter sp. TaxID=1876758 RepID=UPI0039EBC1DD
MGHNYAKPLTAEVRMERVFSRLPEDWAVKMERQNSEGWSVTMQRPDGALHHAMGPVLVDVLEEVWRALR